MIHAHSLARTRGAHPLARTKSEVPSMPIDPGIHHAVKVHYSQRRSIVDCCSSVKAHASAIVGSTFVGTRIRNTRVKRIGPAHHARIAVDYGIEHEGFAKSMSVYNTVRLAAFPWNRTTTNKSPCSKTSC